MLNTAFQLLLLPHIDALGAKLWDILVLMDKSEMTNLAVLARDMGDRIIIAGQCQTKRKKRKGFMFN